jgi:hypothetical protein
VPTFAADVALNTKPADYALERTNLVPLPADPLGSVLEHLVDPSGMLALARG